MSSLDGRVRLLERGQQRAAGCSLCLGHTIYPLAIGEPLPDWIDESARCYGCGACVKLCDRDAWDHL